MSSLGERLQALRREFRASRTSASDDHAGEIMALRRELSALKRQVAGGPKAAPAAKKVDPIKRSTSAVKKSVSKATAKVVHTKAASRAKPATASKSRPSPRKRK